MPALFSRRSNAIARRILLALIAAAVAAPTSLMVYVRTSFASGRHASVPQPVPFDHRIHARDLGVDCRFCHASVEIAAAAGMPPTVACVACHSTVWRESEAFAPIRASLRSGRPVPWRRVTGLPDFVFFDHSIHVAKGVGCATCHGRVDEMAQVTQASSLSMAWCVRCHRDPGPALRPRDAVTTMTWTPPRDDTAAAALRARLTRTYHVRSLTNCSTCHR